MTNQEVRLDMCTKVQFFEDGSVCLKQDVFGDGNEHFVALSPEAYQILKVAMEKQDEMGNR